MLNIYVILITEVIWKWADDILSERVQYESKLSANDLL